MHSYAPDSQLNSSVRRIGAGERFDLVGASVWSGSAWVENARMRIVDGRIESVGPIGSSPGADANHPEIGLDGAFLTAGFIDCHVHLTGLDGHDPFRRNIERYSSVRLVRAVRDAGAILRAGFTTVRHLGHGDPNQAEALKQAIDEGLVAGPKMLTSGWALSQTGGHGNLHAWPYSLVEQLRPRSAFCDGPDECRKFVRRILGDGADCIKIYTSEGLVSSPDHLIDIPNFTAAEIEAIVDEAHRRGVRVAAHATGLEGSMLAVQGGVDTLEHGPHDIDDDFLRLMRSSGATLVPTLSVFEWAASSEAGSGVPAFAAERARRWLEGHRRLVAAAAQAGIPIAVGSDSGAPPRGGRNAEEILAIARAGLSPALALAAATNVGAEALGLGGDVGVLAPGARADIVAWSRDPVADIGVVADVSAIRLILQSEGLKKPW
ncbi:MAG: amidohydrolase family protein [Erythrobacter sp.]|nr:amidohydrolase family protein [Erythrobacter sp.]